MATILLADNEPWLRVLVRATLAPTHRLLEAWDAQQALDLARREHPALVLLDGVAPEMDAMGVCQQLKADPGTRDAVIVLLTPAAAPALIAPSPAAICGSSSPSTQPLCWDWSARRCRPRRCPRGRDGCRYNETG